MANGQLVYVVPVDGRSPVDPGFGGGVPGAPVVPGNELPSPPPGVWPPPNATLPIQPAPPETPPGSIWPPPNRPDAGLPEAPTPPPVAGGGPVIPSSKFWVVAGIPGVGWRYVCVDPSLDAGMPLPPSAQPKG